MSNHNQISRESLLCMAEYNLWATRQLIRALKTIPEDAIRRDNGLFFKSIFGTLNHILVGEHYLWYGRFSKQELKKLTLDTVLETNLGIIFEELEIKSSRWKSLILDLDQATLSGYLNYHTVAGERKSLPFAATLLHVFNHATHHRGQITAALTAMGYQCPELDLVYMLLEKQLFA